jgi:hypothetical protein
VPELDFLGHRPQRRRSQASQQQSLGHV